MSEDTGHAELPESARRLLALERARSAPPADVERRVLERVMTSFVAVPPVAPTAAPPSAAAPASAFGAKLLLVAGVSGLVGAGAGASLHASLSTNEPKVIEVPVFVDRVVERVVERPAAEVAAVEKETPKPRPAPAVVVKAVPPVPEVAPRFEPSDDRGLLEQARTALARGKFDEALSALRDHEAKFPAGQFTEEREGMRVLALYGQRSDEADDAAAKFTERFPTSVLLPAISRAAAR